MFKVLAVLSALCAVASAGLIAPYSHGYGLGYGSIASTYHAPAIISHAPIIKSYATPIVSAPIVKTIAHPVATSYANTYKVATKSYPVAVHAAPAYVHAAPSYVHAAPAVIAAPALHTSSSYHGNYGLGYAGLGYGHGLLH